MNRIHSVPIELMQSMLSASRPRGLNLNSVLENNGLSHLIPVFAGKENDARIDLDDVGTLLRSVWHELGDEASGFLSQPLKVGFFSMMCHAIITAGNLRRALLRSARFISLFGDDISIELTETGNETRLTIHYANPFELDQVFFVTSIFVIWIRLSCWLIDQPMLLERIEFAFEEPQFSDEFSLMFPCRHAFSQKNNMVVFNRRLLNLPIKQDSETLTTFLHNAPESLITQFRADDSLTAQIKRLLLHRNGMATELENLSFDLAAEELKIATHTLRRRLKEEGISFQEIKDSLRRDQAVVLLSKTNLTIQDIASRLGFSEPAAFNRAFKKWTGYTPGQIRNTL